MRARRHARARRRIRRRSARRSRIRTSPPTSANRQLELITGVHASVDACLRGARRASTRSVYRAHRRRDPLVREHAVPACRADDADPDRPLRHLQRRPREDRLPHGPRAPLRPAHADDLGHPLQLLAARHRSNEEYFALIRNFRRTVVAAALSLRRLARGVRELRRRARQHELQRARAGHAVPAVRHVAAHGAPRLPERRAVLALR